MYSFPAAPERCFKLIIRSDEADDGTMGLWDDGIMGCTLCCCFSLHAGRSGSAKVPLLLIQKPLGEEPASWKRSPAPQINLSSVVPIFANEGEPRIHAQI